MKRKVLFVANITKHIISFHIPFLKFFKDHYFEVHVAANGFEIIPYCDILYNVEFNRSPLKFSNLKSYFKLKKIISMNKYNIIHCHTPVGALIARLSAMPFRKIGIKIIYTVHGFHFYKGANLKNWILFYPIEKYLAKYTDHLITINSEDYECALKMPFKKVNFVHGVGVDLNKFTPQTEKVKNSLRHHYGFSPNDFILIYVAEMNYGKHQDLIIDMAYYLKNEVPNLKVILVGTGPMLKTYELYAEKKKISDIIFFFGYRNDINLLLSLSDVYVSASRREGLPISLVEAMAVGIPIVATNCRGNRDLIEHGRNGFLVDVNDPEAFANAVAKIYYDEGIRKNFMLENRKSVVKYSLPNVLKEMSLIYQEYL